MENSFIGSTTGSLGQWLVNRFSLPETPSNPAPDHYPFRLASHSPSLLDERQIDQLMNPWELLTKVGAGPSEYFSPEGALEIEVSHSRHRFRLLAHTDDGEKRILHECKVGLGAPSFPTPVGVYYVTHIYDDNPWWIPPKNRAWAAGQRPSKRVYGGTMAPLLKKKRVKRRSSRRGSRVPSEDLIENRRRYADYGYRFHGTSSPRSIGRNQSHGCVRMMNDDAKKVADLIKSHMGEIGRGETENGEYAILGGTVKLNLVK